MTALMAGGLILTLVGLALLILLDNPREDRGRVSRGWLDRERDKR